MAAGSVFLRLPFTVKAMFGGWLDRHYPERKAKVLGRVRGLRGGKLYESAYRRG